MAELVVVDLGTQAEAVVRHVSGWSKLQVLRWLSRYGEVVRLSQFTEQERYNFRAPTGLSADFWYSPDDDLTILARLGTGYHVVSKGTLRSDAGSD